MMQVSGSPAFTNGHNGIGSQNGKNMSGYSRMCMDCLTQQASIVAFGVAPAFNSDQQYARATFTKGKNERSTVSLDISNINAVGYPWCAHKNGYLLVYRIWME